MYVSEPLTTTAGLLAWPFYASRESLRQGQLVRERRLESQGGIEIGQDGAAAWELLGPKPNLRRRQTGVAPAVLAEKGFGGCGGTLLEKTDVRETVGKGAGFSDRYWIVHGEQRTWRWW